MGVLDVIGAPFKALNSAYDNAAFGQGWQDKVADQSMLRKVQMATQANQLRKASRVEADADMDQRLQNFKSLMPYLEGQLLTDPEAQVPPIDIPMPEGMSFDQLLNAARGNARVKAERERALRAGTARTEQGTGLDVNKDRRAAEEEARRAAKAPLEIQDLKSRIDVREHPRARPTQPKPESEATYQRDYNTAKSMLAQSYKEGELDNPATETQISALAEQIRSRRRTSMGGSAPSSSAPTAKPSTTPSSSPKTYLYQGKQVQFEQLPPNIQAKVREMGL
jgi:hypothetical protein